MLTYTNFFFFIFIIFIVTFSEGKECQGTNIQMTHLHSSGDRYKMYRDMYKGCTIVNTNLEITHLSMKGVIDFLDDIREIKGYMMFVSNSYPTTLSLPNLRIVRGYYTWKNSSFSIIHNKKLTSILFPTLREISFGKVWIVKNAKLCHVDTITWKEVMYGRGDVVVSYNSVACEACSQECSYSGKVSCWSATVCQKIEKLKCEKACDTGCPKDEPKYCCDSQCIGGCSAISASQCFECRSFKVEGICVATCPELFTYNHVNMIHEPNPNGRYSYMDSCVVKCPTSTVIHNGFCLQSCPLGYEEGDKHTCKLCYKEKGCPKTCAIPNNKHFQQRNHHLFINCTLIEGHLKIFNYTIARENLKYLEYLSEIREITGMLIIQGEHAEFKNLNFLRNLKVIRGHRFLEDKRNNALTISATTLEIIILDSLESIEDNGLSIKYNNHLRYLNFPKLKSIKRPREGLTVEVKMNPKLCYVTNKRFEGFALGLFDISHNRNFKECEEEKLLCDEECKDGCWGSGPNKCTTCKNYICHGSHDYQCSVCKNARLYHAYIINKTNDDNGGGGNPQKQIKTLLLSDNFKCVKTCPKLLPDEEDDVDEDGKTLRIGISRSVGHQTKNIFSLIGPSVVALVKTLIL